MEAKLFKAFTPLLNLAINPTEIDFDVFRTREAIDPGKTQWRSMGFRPFDTGEFHMDVQGAGTLACIEIADRMLPGQVIKDKLIDRVASIIDRTGRKPGKKEFAELREEVIFELLPSAFIRRKLIPVLFFGNKVIVFTSSAKTCDDCISVLAMTIADIEVFNPTLLDNQIQKSATGVMSAMAKQGSADSDSEIEEDQYSTLEVTNTAVLKGANKQTIRIKDKDISSHDISDLLRQEYDVVLLGLEHLPAGETEPDAGFVMNDKLVFTGFKLPDVTSVRGKSAKDDDDTFMSTAWLTARTVRGVLDTVISVMGGLRPIEGAKGACDRVQKVDEEEDDEL